MSRMIMNTTRTPALTNPKITKLFQKHVPAIMSVRYYIEFSRLEEIHRYTFF